ncbi:MAG: LacI family DNA-binding transcriptional regulator [Gaiellaceae bacterium]
MEAERPPTLADVARVARVATSTASRALQESSRISEPTKLRVRAAAQGLGYRPNRIAQSLRTRSANIVGLVVPDIGAPFYSRVVKGAQSVFEQNGYAVLMMNTERRPEREDAAIHTLLEHRVRGVLVATSGGSTAVPEVPTVYYDNIIPNRGVGNVTRANVAGMALLVEHLRTHGHERIGYIGGPPTLTSGIERLGGYQAAVRELGLVAREEYVQFSEMDWSPHSGAEAMQRLLAVDEPPTAVVTSGESLALGALSVCRTNGRRVPDDVALASFDDPPFGDLLDPPLTALSRNEEEMGRLAASLLLHALQSMEPSPAAEVRLPLELVVRRSCGCQ